MPTALIFSRALARIPHLHVFLHELSPQRYRPWQRQAADAVVGWGYRPTTRRARAYAAQHGLPYIALEDGFIRSLGLGVAGWPPLSLVADDLGMYYDAARPSRLERIAAEAGFGSSEYREAAEAMALICRHRISKYNHAPDHSGCLNAVAASRRRKVLVADQTAGDMSVQYGMADAATFAAMLAAAVAENPDADIWVKIHPDVLCGKKSGFFQPDRLPENVRYFGEDVHPMALLEPFDRVYCVTSQLGFEALLLGKTVTVFGVPWYAAWGLTDDRHDYARQLAASGRRPPRRLEELFIAAYLRYSRYLKPGTDSAGSLCDVLHHLIHAKAQQARMEGTLFCVGVSLWKRTVIRPFFAMPRTRLHFVRSLKQLQRFRLPEDAKLLVWGAGTPPLLDFARTRRLPVVHIEDGFIRSVGLGSNLVAAMSLVVDDLGIYFNPQQPSRLEAILLQHNYGEDALAHAESLRRQLIAHRITKYNVGKPDWQPQAAARGKTRILVPGQVEDDASIRLGARDIRTNLALLQAVRQARPDAYIVYKPHPDVESGNRIGRIPRTEALRYADEIAEYADITHCIDNADEVHTITSLCGFEALMRGKKVACYGIPFYAGWGLTADRHRIARRSRTVSLAALIYAALVDYPQYIDPHSRQTIDAATAAGLVCRQRLPHRHGLYRSWWSKQWGKARRLWQVLLR